MTNVGCQRYQATQITTANQANLILLLYEGAIRFCTQAVQELEAGHLVAKGEHVGKATAIVAELADALDYERGGDIAHNLGRLYSYMAQLLVTANRSNEAGPIREVITLLSHLRTGWVAVAHAPSTSERSTAGDQAHTPLALHT